MTKPIKITYEGKTFYVQSTGRYFTTRAPILGERLLHRIVWTQAFGPVPDKHEIHHVNEDWTDNRIENLECIDAVKHQRDHMLEKYKDPAFMAARLKDLESAQIAAKAWHSSTAGIEWHKKHGKESWVGRKQETVKCSVCGVDYETFFPTMTRFCSKSCEQKEAFQRAKTSIGTCILCGTSFNFNKYRTQDCCSRACSNKARGLKQRGLWDSYKKPQDQ